jgi:hypothetical protein
VDNTDPHRVQQKFKAVHSLLPILVLLLSSESC